MNESSFEGVGGLKIATRSWQPEGKPRAVMILVHGFNAHSGYMVWPAEQFAAHGLAAYALDHRGRGKSEGERFYVEEFSDYLGRHPKLDRRADPGRDVGGYGSLASLVQHSIRKAAAIGRLFRYYGHICA